MKMLKISLIAIVSFVLLGVVAFYVDYYFYSWTSFVNPFGCRCKQIRVKHVPDKKNNILEQNYDLVKIGKAVESDGNYKEFYFDLMRLSVSRKFSNVTYNIRIDQHKASIGSYLDIYFSNDYTDKTTPNYFIQQNINQMIDELPLSSEQKEELKSKVTVSCRHENLFAY
jgi:hypothetical protein